MSDNLEDKDLENMSFDEIMDSVFSTIPYHNRVKLSEIKIAEDTINPSGFMRSGALTDEEREKFLKCFEDDE